jgi:hypothetical protein
VGQIYFGDTGQFHIGGDTEEHVRCRGCEKRDAIGFATLARWGLAGDAIPGNGRAVGLVICGVFGAVGLAALPQATSVAHLNLLAILLGLTVGGFGSLADARR